MNKFLIIGDSHGKKFNLDRLESMLINSKELASDTDATVFLGDLNDSKSIIRSEIQTLYMKYFSKWPNKLIILVGNHDYHNAIECKEHSLEIFKNIKSENQIIIVDKMQQIDNMIFSPYYHETTKFKEDLSKFDSKYLFMHQGVDGCLYSSGTPEQSDLKKKDLKRFTRVIGGHIHMHQVFDNIDFIGSPFTQNFGEAGEKKFIAIFDKGSNKLDYMKTNIPQHIIIEREINDIKDIAGIKKELTDDTNIIKLIIRCPKSISSKIKRSMFVDCSINSLKVDPIKEDNDKIFISSTMSNDEAMKTFIDSLNTELDKKELMEINNIIMGEVK